MTRRRKGALAVFLLAFIALGEPTAGRFVRATTLLVSLSEAHAEGRTSSAAELRETDLTLPGRHGPIRARLYRRVGAAPGRGLVVAHGVHYQGIDEGRLVPFSRALARAGLSVLTPELSDIADYRITRQGVDTISDSVLALSRRQADVSSPEVGVLGFSFAGGLSLVAAERPELEGHLAFVASVGGHHDLRRVLHFLMSNEIDTPQGMVPKKAHEYGLVVLVYGQLDHFVPAPDRAVLRDAFREWLHGNRDAARAIASRRTSAEGERLFSLLEQERLGELRPQLESLLREHADELSALSPAGQLRAAKVPIYLLHGSGDDVIPASETRWADRELAGRPHQALVSPLLEHVEVSHTASVGDQLQLVRFMAALL